MDRNIGRDFEQAKTIQLRLGRIASTTASSVLVHKQQGRKPLGRKSRHTEIKGVNVMSPALPDVEGFS
jgi:hypothetical protein